VEKPLVGETAALANEQVFKPPTPVEFTRVSHNTKQSSAPPGAAGARQSSIRVGEVVVAAEIADQRAALPIADEVS
jgi:hypothetical protein